jgi:hypothetical protein
MSRWLISVPVWGTDYVRTFVEIAAPALRIAARRLVGARFIIHTDAPDAVRDALGGLQGFPVNVRPVPAKPTYVALQEGHAEAIREAAPGDRVVLLNADLVVSANFFARIDEHFAAGRRAVVLLGIRTVIDASRGPGRLAPGAAPRALLEWAWANRHQIIRDLEWPQATSMLPTNLFFARGGSVVARGFHLHPAAIIKHDAIAFSSTIDGDLLDYFAREDIHVVTDPDDCAMLEVSPAERRFPVQPPGLSPARVAASMATRASATHRWLATHRIGVVGPVIDCGDSEVVAAVLAIMEGSPPTKIVGHRGVSPAGRRGRP